MSRSRVLTACFVVLLLLLAAPPIHPAGETKVLDLIETIDYARGRAVVRVGSWVKYHVTSKSELGVSDDYTVTLLLAGEERLWGEDCFWLETWTQAPGRADMAAATLMSSTAFADSLIHERYQMYQRKLIADLDEDGNPVEQVVRRGAGATRTRSVPTSPVTRKVDSLGTEVVNTVKGQFLCTKVRTEMAVGKLGQSADSSEYVDSRKVNLSFRTRAIPITGIAREELDYGMWRRAWFTGHSQESSPRVVMDRSLGTVELVDFGSGGLEARLVPKAVRRSLAEQDAARAAAKAKTAPARRGTVRR